MIGYASSETRAKALSLKAALEKPGVTYAVCLIGRHLALMEPLVRKLQTVGISVPCVKSMIASVQSVLDQNRMDFTAVASSKIYDEACALCSGGTTVQAERSFACMRPVKIRLRSAMASDRLSNLCVLYCHQER